MTQHRAKTAWRRAPHLDLISDAIVAAIRGEIPPVIVCEMPPRHGKSWMISRTVPGWYLDLFPEKNVMLASYNGDFAREWGQLVRDDLKEFAELGLVRVRISAARKGAAQWKTTDGGGMKTAGVGGGFTGRGADLLIIDDPLSNMEEAQSETIRKKIWEWWQSTSSTRMEPGAIAVVLMTRWHEDDLIGHLLYESKHGGPAVYELRLPAIAELPSKTNPEPDALGRAEGEPLWPERYDVAALAAIKLRSGPYVWASLYQQRPAPLGGLLFRRADFRYWTRDRDTGLYRLKHSLDEGDDALVEPKSLRRFLTVDLAISLKQTADYTAIGHWGATKQLDLLLLNAIHERMEGPDHLPLLLRANAVWKPGFIGIESVQYQAALLQGAIRKGLSARKLDADTDKVTRSLPATARFAAHTVFLPEPAEADFDEPDYELELLTFPNSAHDDWVDMTSYAALTIQQPWFTGAGQAPQSVGAGKKSYWLGGP